MSPDFRINGESPPKVFLNNQTELLTVREVSKRLKVSTATVYKLVDKGELAHVRVSNAIRIPVTAVDAYSVGFFKAPPPR